MHDAILVILLGVLIPGQARADGYSDLILSHSPIAYWRMNETGGMQAMDIVGGHIAAYNATPSFGRPGAIDTSSDSATGFLGGGNWATAPHHVLLNPQNAFTLTFLARLAANHTSYQTVISSLQWDGATYKGFWVAVHPTNKYWYFFTGAGPTTRAVSGGFHVPGQWDHVAVTWKANGGTNGNGVPTGTMAIYVNGSKASQTESGAYLAADLFPFDIGVRRNGEAQTPIVSYSWDGDIDEVVLLDHALTDSQIRTLAETALAPSNRTFYVRKSGSDTNNGLSPGTAFATFDHGIRHLRAGDTLYVGAGEYTLDAQYTRFDGTGRDGAPVRIIGDTAGEQTGDAGQVTIRGHEWTTIDSEGNETTRYSYMFYALYARNIHLESLTFADGGYAMYFYDCQDTMIAGCECTGQHYASIYCNYGSAIIKSCNLHDNAQDGILAYRGEYSVLDTQIENCASGYGLYFYRHPDEHGTQDMQCLAEGVTIRGSGSWALRSYYCNATIRNCTIEDNQYGVICFGGSNLIDVVIDDEEDSGGSKEDKHKEDTEEDSGTPKLYWHPTVIAENVHVRGCQNSWAFYTAYTDTTLRNCVIENNIDGVLCYDNDTRNDIDRLTCVAEGLMLRNNNGWAIHFARVNAEASDIVAENNKYGVSFWDKERLTGSDNRCTASAARIRVTGTTEYWGLRGVRVDLDLCDSQILNNLRGIYLYEDEGALGTGSRMYLDRIEVRHSSLSWGLYCCRADLDLRNSLIADNRYGLYCLDMDEGSQLWHVSVINNDSHGIYNRGGFMSVHNCLSTGASSGYGLVNYEGTLVNDYNLVVGNYRNYYYCNPGQSSVYGVPIFADTEDYHLLDTSPGVNGGMDPGELCPQDLEGYDRCQNGGWDVGCYATTVPGWEYDDLPHAYESNHPISWWRLGEGVDNDVAVDIVGNNHGAYENGVRRGRVSPISEDGCVFFDGVDDQIRISHRDDYLLDDGTVLLWYRTNMTPHSWSGIFTKDTKDLGTGGQISIMAYNSTYGRPYAYHQTIDTYLPVYPDTDEYQTEGEWTFIAYTFGSHGITLYVNGAMVMRRAQNPEGWGPTSGGAGNYEPIFLGASSYWSASGQTYPYHRLNGWMDEVAIFNRQLSAAEIIRIYRAALHPKRDPSAMQIPPLWGVTGTNGKLIRIDNYTDPANSMTDFGPILWHDENKNKTLSIGNEIDSLSIESKAMAYLLVNKTIGNYQAPVLMSLNLQEVESGIPLIASPISEIKIGGGVRDIAVDADTGLLYALRADGHLYSIDPTTGNAITDFGELKNDALGLHVENGVSMMFDQTGALFVLDAYDNHLYHVNKSSAVISHVPDPMYGGGLYASAWDHLAHRAVASNTSNNTLRHLTLIPGNNPSFGSLGGTGIHHVQGLSFVPNEGRGNTSGGWRVIQWLEVR